MEWREVVLMTGRSEPAYMLAWESRESNYKWPLDETRSPCGQLQTECKGKSLELRVEKNISQWLHS